MSTPLTAALIEEASAKHEALKVRAYFPVTVGPKLLDYTDPAHPSALGMFLYVWLGWIVWPIASLLLLANGSTRMAGTVLFLLWLFTFALPRMIEGIALWMLGGVVIVGILKGMAKQLK